MSTQPTFEEALERVLLAAKLRAHELEVTWRNEQGDWLEEHWNFEHAQLSADIAKVEAAFSKFEAH